MCGIFKFCGEKHFSQIGTVQNTMEALFEDGKSRSTKQRPAHPPALVPANCTLRGVKMVCYMSANTESVSNNSTEGSFILSSEINHHCHSILSQAANSMLIKCPQCAGLRDGKARPLWDVSWHF